MKLVPEFLYKKAMQLDEDREDSLKESKRSVLNEDIPNEIKAILYQDYLRALYKKRQIDDSTPILVENVTQPVTLPNNPPSPVKQTKQHSYSKREEALLAHMENSGISLSANRELIINGRLFPKSNIDRILTALRDVDGHEIKVKGFKNLLGVLRQTKAPATVFPIQYEHLLQSRSKRKQTGKGFKLRSKRKQSGKGVKLKWTSYHN